MPPRVVPFQRLIIEKSRSVVLDVQVPASQNLPSVAFPLKFW
jgi:hypothetical protein